MSISVDLMVVQAMKTMGMLVVKSHLFFLSVPLRTRTSWTADSSITPPNRADNT